MGGAKTGTGLTFGERLRRHRATAGITQEELAKRTGLTPQAIGLLERGERRRPHGHTVGKLADALGLQGQDLAEFESAARRAPPTGRRALPASRTTLVGREREVAAVADLLLREAVRLVTLTGPGGVGKTRLALETAARAADDSREEFGDGVVFVQLAPLRDPAEVPFALAKELGIGESAGRDIQETLEIHLRDRRTLALLDNFEHLPDAAALVSRLLRTCPRLTVLATSRAPLRLVGEHQFPVPPLALPEVAKFSMPAGVPVWSAAVELFCQRARAVDPAFELTAENATAVAGICRRLDGLPLAIELAAARVKLFSPRSLLERLDRRLQLLAGGARDLPERQRTLRDAVAWSDGLLDRDGQRLFRRLAVFSGGFTLEAVEAVCKTGASGQVMSVVETLADLVDNSLLAAESGSHAGREDSRFTMLETIREYAAESLESSGEAEDIRRAHALHYLALAEATQPGDFMRTWQEWWWTRLEEEHDNLRAALRWALRSREPEIGARLASALWRFWSARHPSEGLRSLEALLVVDGTQRNMGGSGLPRRKRAFLLLVAGILAARFGDYDRAVARNEESLALYRSLGHRKGTHAPLRELGAVAYHRQDYGEAVRLNEQALAVAREVGSVAGAGLAVCNLADALRAQGDLDRARTLLQESLASLRSQGQRANVGNALVNTLTRLGSIEFAFGEAARAAESFEESLGLMWRFVGRAYETVACMGGLARAAAMQDRPERAARLLGASAALRDEVGAPLSPIVRTDHDHATKAARRALGVEAFEAAWAAGHAMPIEKAVAYALDDA